MKMYLYNMLDAGSRPINPQPLSVEAKDMGHAMQKIAAALSDDCAYAEVWEVTTAS